MSCISQTYDKILFRLNTILFIEHLQLLHVSADFCHQQAWFTQMNCKVTCFKLQNTKIICEKYAC